MSTGPLFGSPPRFGKEVPPRFSKGMPIDFQ
jgi:hypothetical protein